MSVRIITRSAPFYAGVLLVLATIALFVFEHNAVPKKTERLSDKMFLSGDHTPGRDVMSAPLVSTDNTNPNTRPTVNSTAAASSNESQKAPMLVNLVGGLEAKVAADPGNIGNQILLAQTYAEVGRIPDGVGPEHSAVFGVFFLAVFADDGRFFSV